MPFVLQRHASEQDEKAVKLHLESCRICWSIWNRLRWKSAAETIHLKELKEYLGSAFQDGVDSSWLLVEDWNSKSRDTRETVEQFYESTEWYVYNQVIFAASGQRPNYGVEGLRKMMSMGVESILDVGCGVGTDGLEFAAAGMKVLFFDINRRCLDFLRWRIKRRDLRNTAVTASVKGHHNCEALWLMDVVEHLPHPEVIIAPLLPGVRIIFVDTHSASAGGGRHPFHYDQSIERTARLLRQYSFESRPEGRLQVWELVR